MKAAIGTRLLLLIAIYVESHSVKGNSQANNKSGCPGLSRRQYVRLNYGLHSAEDGHGSASWVFEESNKLPYSHMASLEKFWNQSLVAAWQVKKKGPFCARTWRALDVFHLKAKSQSC